MFHCVRNPKKKTGRFLGLSEPPKLNKEEMNNLNVLHKTNSNTEILIHQY